VARDVYHRHPYELGEEQVDYVREFIALAQVEAEEVMAAREGS
jgi:hypothetical protein